MANPKDNQHSDTAGSPEIVKGIPVYTVPPARERTANSITLEVLCKCNNVQPAGDRIWKTDCPHCNGAGYLTIIANPGGEQKVLFDCFSKCSTENICKALGLSVDDLVIKNKQDNNPTNKTDVSIVSGVPIAPKAKNDISSFVAAIEKHFNIRYNELSQRAEIYDGKHWRDFSDADEAFITQYCQDVYGISNRANLRDAILICQQDKRANPLLDTLSSLVWDGKPRTAQFLHDVLKCEDNAINREISQMIFTGGVRRAFEPGCKWDNVPILVGGQGSGKSTTVDLLGLGYSAEIRTFSGKEAIENIGGVWIGEIGELSAMRRAKDLEEIKSFITTQFDKYRKPYAHIDVKLPRRCIFIGTTNSSAFLTDQTGNRRFFPVTVHSDGRKIWKHIDEIKEYIRQAWAEAVVYYNKGTLPADYDHSIDFELNKIRDGFKDDDWKIGAFDTYLESKKDGDCVCCLELWVKACRLDEEKLTRNESLRIGEYLDNHPEWVRLPANKRPRFTINGRSTQQRAWEKCKYKALLKM